MKEFYDEMKKYYEYWWENPRDPRDFILKNLMNYLLKDCQPAKIKKR
jgi:hypothetical protein